MGVEISFVIAGLVFGGHGGAGQGRRWWKSSAILCLVRDPPLYWVATTLEIATVLVLPSTVLHTALAP